MDYPVTFLKLLRETFCWFIVQGYSSSSKEHFPLIAFSSYSTSHRISSFSQQNNTQKSYSLQFMRAFSVKIFFIKLLLAQIPLSPGDFWIIINLVWDRDMAPVVWTLWAPFKKIKYGNCNKETPPRNISCENSEGSPICTSVAILEIATKRTKIENRHWWVWNKPAK